MQTHKQREKLARKHTPTNGHHTQQAADPKHHTKHSTPAYSFSTSRNLGAHGSAKQSNESLC
jgi:hypothetical protein